MSIWAQVSRSALTAEQHHFVSAALLGFVHGLINGLAKVVGILCVMWVPFSYA